MATVSSDVGEGCDALSRADVLRESVTLAVAVGAVGLALARVVKDLAGDSLVSLYKLVALVVTAPLPVVVLDVPVSPAHVPVLRLAW